MSNYQKAIKNYNLSFNNLLEQNFERIDFGSDIEANAGNSAASFRASDSPDYVNKILTEKPVSWVEENPHEVEALRQLHGVGELKDDVKPMEVGFSDELAGKIFENATPFITRIGVLSIATVLILGGLIIIAFQSETVKTAAKTAAKAAAV